MHHSTPRKFTRSCFLALGVLRVEPAIVVVDQFAQRPGTTVREVRRASGQTAHLLHDDRADVRASAGDEGAPRIGRVDDAAEKRMRRRILAARQFEHRQLLRRRV
jgi:hypothetical protein